MISASPPTERNARTGLFTPPTNTCSARANIPAERALFFTGDAFDVLMKKLFATSTLQPFRRVFRVIRQDNVRARPLNTCQQLQHSALFIQPASLRRCFDHRVFSAHVV